MLFRGILTACTFLISHYASAIVFQAEDYTYSYDTTAGNTGGAYRSDDVDIEVTSDSGGGYNVGWVDATEWLAFNNVNLPSTGNYRIKLRVASAMDGGELTLDLNGGTIILTSVAVPNTGGWQNWQTIELSVRIDAGVYNSLGIFANSGGWNLNWIEIIPENVPTPTPTITPTPTPTPSPTVPPTELVSLYQHCNYSGWVAQLGEGQFTLSQLLSLGFINDDASSLQVAEGYEVVLYQNDNFTGNQTIISADDTCLVNEGFNDDVSSLIVRKQNINPGSGYRSEKRGLAYGHHSVNDLNVMQNKVRWWYNWSEAPEASVANQYQDYGFDFVPMAWDENFNESRLRSYLDAHPEVKYILGFNEPNFVEQANLTPAQAAAQWPRIEAIARDYNLKIVGPAVNYSPGQVDIPGTDDDSSPWAYLDAFFAACPNCQVDYIAMHSYMRDAAAVEWFVGEFERYGKPIWLTEWASWDDGGPANVNQQMDYLASTVRMLEANPMVYRYAWFIGRGEGSDVFPYLDILAGDGELTALGGLYTSIPANDYVYSIPMRIEAEGAHQNFGFQHEATSDSSGGYVNLCWANTGDYLQYKIRVPTSGLYTIDLRLATALDARQLNILLNGSSLYAQNVNSTGGWQSWNTFSQQVNLPAGEHTLRIEALTNDININWLEIR